MATRERPVGPLLVAVLLAAVALRGWLAFQSQLASGTFFDERFSFRNVHDLVARGSLRPDNAYYPSLSYLPHSALLALAEAAHRVTGIESLSIYDPERADGFSATAYALARSVSVIAGTLSVWLVFLLGRRLFEPRVGLLAATLLAAAPNHILNSSHFKPDILVDLLALVTLWWSLDAILHPSRGRYLAAGCGVGLAAAAKYNGAGVALPLVLGTLVTGREVRRWGWLALAGIASIALFVLLNPFLGTVAEYLGRQVEMYEHKGRAEGWTFWGMMQETARLVVVNLRWPFALLAAVGGLGAVGRALRRRTPRRRRLEASMLLFFVVGFPALYAASTDLFRDQNVLPALSLSCLLAAWPGIALWNVLVHGPAGRLPAGARRAGAAVVCLALAVAVFAYPVEVVYRRVVPTTFERVERLLGSQLAPVHLRHAYYEGWGTPGGAGPLRPRRGGRYLATVEVERLAGLDEALLDRADAEVFRVERLEGEDRRFYMERVARRVGRARRLEPAAFRVRGPALGVLLHAWTLEAEPRPLRLRPAGAPGRYRARVEGGAPGIERPAQAGELVSLSLWLPVPPGRPLPEAVRVGGRPVALFPTQGVRDRVHFVTGRFRPPPGGELVLELVGGGTAPSPAEVEAELCRWSPPRGKRRDRGRGVRGSPRGSASELGGGP